MTSRRDWQLQQLGIAQWTLRRPAALQGEIAIHLPPHVRLTIVAAAPPADDDPLLADVLRSLTLSAEQTLGLTPQQAAMLPEKTRCHVWLLGVDLAVALDGVRLVSPPLSELHQDAGAKRALWQQICAHEHDLTLDAGRSGPRLSD